MWIKPGASQPTPQHFDEHYLANVGGHLVLKPEVQERLDEVLYLTGPVWGMRILDLGGGALLGRACEHASLYRMVDMSGEACRLCKQVAPWADDIQMDVWEYLKWGAEFRFDVTVAIGLVEYLPQDFLDYLFWACPSPVLAFTTAVKEAYLKYPARITVPSREDVAEVAKRYGWEITRELKRPDHIWARYERVK